MNNNSQSAEQSKTANSKQSKRQNNVSVKCNKTKELAKLINSGNSEKFDEFLEKQNLLRDILT